MKYLLVPLGCQMNRSDAERIETVLGRMGFMAAVDDDDDEIVIKGIVACSVRQQAIDRVYGRIRKWNASKNKTRLLTFVTGCILPEDREKLLKLFDFVFPIDQLPALPDLVRQYGVSTPLSMSSHLNNADKREQDMDKYWKVSPRYSSSVEAYVPIQNGCDKFCSFCAVPYTRGREISRSSSDILAEVRTLVEAGYKSITLLGQNVNSYGLDRLDTELTFPQLLKEIGEIGRQTDEYFWLYFTSPHPRDFTRELLSVIASSPVLADWIHLPLQSGNNEVLHRMNRNYTAEHFRHVVNDVRRILPNAALFTDIIVGFSGESDEQFQDTIQMMMECRFDMAYIARYSPRPGARSAKWKDDVEKKEKQRRFRILNDLMLKIMTPVNADRKGQILRALVTAQSARGDFLAGHTEGRLPVRLKADDRVIGQFVDLEITGANPLSIEGKIVGSPSG